MENKHPQKRRKRREDPPSSGLENPVYKSEENGGAVELQEIQIDGPAVAEKVEAFKRPNIFTGLSEVVNLFLTSHSVALKRTVLIVVAVGFHVYLGLAIAHSLQKSTGLLALTILFWFALLYYKILKPLLGDFATNSIYKPLESTFASLSSNKIVRWIFALLVVVAIGVYLYFDTMSNRWRLVSFAGLIFYMIILILFSKNPGQIRWRPVFWGIFLQFLMGVLVLKWSVGNIAFSWLGNQFATFVSYTQNGTSFVYGFLVTPPNICGLSPVFAFSSLQTILYLGAIIGILYYLEVMQFIVMRMAWIMQFTMGTTGPESLSAAASIFLGTIESPLAIRPYMTRLTDSEWFAIMTAGLSTIAGSVFAIYISFGACPVHLLAASFMSAPASLAVAKLFFPETQESKLKRVADLKLAKSNENNVIEAAVNGASAAMEIVFNVIATLIVFLALLAFFNNVLMWLGAMVGVEGLTFEKLMSWIFFPFAFMMGASDLEDPVARNADILKVAELMGIKVTLNEFIAYQRLSTYIANRSLSKRATVVATYALCGFSNIGAMGMALGGLGTLCPERKGVLARIAFRALIASNIACFMTACMAGLLSADMEYCGEATNGTGTCFQIP